MDSDSNRKDHKSNIFNEIKFRQTRSFLNSYFRGTFLVLFPFLLFLHPIALKFAPQSEETADEGGSGQANLQRLGAVKQHLESLREIGVQDGV